MTRVILYAIAAVLGAVYAIFPRWFLSKKYGGGEVTEKAVRTARVFGIVIAVLGAVLAVAALRNI